MCCVIIAEANPEPCAPHTVSLRTAMLIICIPAFNEAPTIGLLLWRIRKVFEESPREYEIIVFDDGSSDSTADTLKPYADVLPLTILRSEEHRGYGAALDTLARAAAKRTRYPRRDAMVLMQADFTDQPEHLPELARRFDGGADLVIAESAGAAGPVPIPVRRLRRIAPLLVRPFVKLPGVSDPFGTFRLMRMALVRDLVRAAGESPITRANGWAANVELLLKVAPLARRMETVALGARYDLRPRDTRVRALADAMDLYRFSRAQRARRVTA